MNLKKTKSIIYILSFFIPLLLCAIFWACVGIYPGSERTLLQVDMYAQYVPFYESLKNILAGGDNSFFYNWSIFVGENNIGNLTYYLMSPITWLIVFFDIKNIAIGIYFILLVRFGFLGLTFSIFLCNRPYKTFEFTKYNIVGIIVFSCCFALMNYNAMYIICPMWIDAEIMLPLIILGIENIITGKKSLLYFFSFLSSMFLSYYITYMIAIFSVIYFIYYYLSVKNETSIKFFTALRKFIINSFFAGLLPAFLLLPTLYQLSLGKTITSSKYVNYSNFTGPILRFFTRFVSYNYVTYENNAFPLLFCGTIIFVLAIFSIFKEKRIRIKLFDIFLILLFMLSFWVRPLDKIWHGFSMPICFPYRYSFLLSFFILILGFDGYVLVCGKEFKLKKILCYIFVLFSGIELFFCTTITRTGTIVETGGTLQSSLEFFLEKYKNAFSYIKSVEEDENYRVDKDGFSSMNDQLILDYKGIQGFSSLYDNRHVEFFTNMGFKTDFHIISSLGSTMITDSFFGVKYYVNYVAYEDYLKYIWDDGRMSVYVNPYAMSYGTVLPYDIEPISFDESNAFINQNLFLSAITGEEKVAFSPVEFEAIPLTNEELVEEYNKVGLDINNLTGASLNNSLDIIDYEEVRNYKLLIDNPSGGRVYIFVDFNKGEYYEELYTYYYGEKRLIVDGSDPGMIIERGDYGCILDLGVLDSGITHEVLINNLTDYDNIYIYRMDYDLVCESFDNLNTYSRFTNVFMDGGNMTADLNTDYAGTVLTSIPYAKGWTIYVDGVPTEYDEALNCFITFNVSEGNHKIEMKFVSPYFKEGCIISGILAAIYILLCIITYKTKKYDIL